MADNVTIKVGLMTSAVKSGLAKIREDFGALKGSIAGLATGFAAAFSFGKALEKAEEIGRVSRQFGISAEEVQKLGAAAKKVGIDMETVAKGGFKAFAESQKALSGDKSAAETFEKLGITLEQLSHVHGPRDAILLIAGAVEQAADKHVALAAAADLVGTRQAGLIQLFQMGRTKIEELGDAAVIMGDKTVEGLERAQKALNRFNNVATVTAGNVLGTIQDKVEALANALGALFSGKSSYAISDKADLTRQYIELTKAATDALQKGRQDRYESAMKARGEVEAKLNKIEAPDEFTPPGEDAEDAAKALAKERREKEQMARLQEELAHAELENQRALLDLDAQRNSLIKERAELLKDVGELGCDSAEGLKRRIAAERITAEIQRADKEKQAESDRAGKAAQAIEEKRASLRERQTKEGIDEIEDPAKKLEALEKRRAELFKKGQGEKDPSKQLDVAGEIIGTDREISGLKRKLANEKEHAPQREVVADRLTKIGLGGGAFVRSNDPQAQSARSLKTIQTDTTKSREILEQINGKTGKPRWES